ncbi:four-carbon acid sugar kinase family protein [Siccirubricoccus sp. KC 17139]|uniref:Four-carbon acid sugar kinase family protein n=1 Tax=Siccirubricoccus soli TaxID=2899147 RepID=A0ABT1D394_9PROT|nr:four-carbon acid sugar kinase family protein [Siccirubricoccus soli]MCO6416396.1 four-carbon acid sugar kinase family protein [Siccirubricoccus soli]MCP2682530.1 four-carbon acid sugar kinase family protein [Siccirubricoccus soli]
MIRPMLRLLADDLTGALDTAAEFSALCGPVPVRWDGAAPAGSLALSSATREASREAAVAAVQALAPALAGADIAYRKLDSLLRGKVAAELAACWATGAWRHAIIAPAFPAQRRIARGCQVFAGTAGGGWAPVAMPNWAAEGLELRPGRLDAPLPPGLAWFDAESEAEMECIAVLGRAAAGPVLWCGSGGLARALAGEARVTPAPGLEPPVLGLFGSNQAVTARQLAACGAAWMPIRDAGEAPRVARQLERLGVALVSLDLPTGLARAAAAARIAEVFTALLAALPRPGTLLVAGGETLGAVCAALGAEALLAHGLVQPGVPRSRLQGGSWDGLPVISKSGAFGGDALWCDLLAANTLLPGSIEA